MSTRSRAADWLSIHYLFRRDLGGTAFYRHRKTGFEFIDESRNEIYLASLRQENLRPDTAAKPATSTATPTMYEQIASQDGIFNRMLDLPAQLPAFGLHREGIRSGSQPATGRLSINSFVDMRR